MRNLFASIFVHLALAASELVSCSCSRVSPPRSFITQGVAFCTPFSAPGASPRWTDHRRRPHVLERCAYRTLPRVSVVDVRYCLAGRQGDVHDGQARPEQQESVELEIRRLMSTPTIDIKLELQMLGIDHRDTFEKVDLARRLAEARIASSRPKAEEDQIANPFGGEHPRQRGDDDGRTSAGRWNKESSSTRETSEGYSSWYKGSVDEQYSQDLARATRLGKPALIRELNGLGVSHSRLSDIKVLAQQYARARGDERRETAEASSLKIERDLERHIHDSSVTGVDDGQQEKGDRRRDGWTWVRWTPEQRDEAESLMAWHGEDEAVYMEDGEEGERENGGTGIFGRFKGDGVGIRTDELIPNSDSTRDVRTSRDGVTRDEPIESMRVPLEARASRMSSRELMNALDSLGVQYSIPSARSTLEEAFVSAVHVRHVDGGSVSGDDEGGRRMARLNPFPAGIEKATAAYEPPNFGSYHAALRWARQLTFGDVIDELRYRGVEVEPNADFAYMTRLLADEVIAEEEMMAVQDSEEFRIEVERTMSMSSDALRHELETQGVNLSPDSSKMRLAHRLAEANVRQSRAAKGDPPSRSAGLPRSRIRDPLRGKTSGYDGGTIPLEGSSPSRTRQTRRRERETGTRQPGSIFGDLLEFGLDGDDDTIDEDALVELGAMARSVSGAAWSIVQETASLAAGAALTLLEEAFPDEEDRYYEEEGEKEEEEERTGVSRERSKQSQRRKSVKRRTRGIRHWLGTFMRSSANRAGLTVIQSVANGVVRVAEAAADWAGGGVVAREYVLLIVAVFCLAFKRGVSSSIALLVVIRACRLAVQGLWGRDLSTAGGVAASSAAERPSAFRVAKASSRGSRLPPREGHMAPGSSRSSKRRDKVGSPRGEQGFERRRRGNAGPERTRKRRGETGRPGRRRNRVDDDADRESDEEGCKVM